MGAAVAVALLLGSDRAAAAEPSPLAPVGAVREDATRLPRDVAETVTSVGTSLGEDVERTRDALAEDLGAPAPLPELPELSTVPTLLAVPDLGLQGPPPSSAPRSDAPEPPTAEAAEVATPFGRAPGASASERASETPAPDVEKSTTPLSGTDPSRSPDAGTTSSSPFHVAVLLGAGFLAPDAPRQSLRDTHAALAPWYAAPSGRPG